MRGKGLPALLLSALALLVMAQPAAGVKLYRHRAHVIKGPPGSLSVFNKISDGGTAVGQRLLADGTSHSLISTPRPINVPHLGGQSALVSVDVRNDMAGSLFGAGGPSPLFIRGAQAITLPVTGSANAVALGPLVAVTATGSDGLQHVLVWNPVAGSVRDLGPGIARGINADGVVVGQTLAGEAAYWGADGLVHPVGVPGSLLQVNLFGRVVGFTTRSGGPRPISLNLSNPGAITPLKLPRGWRYGTAKGLADNGAIVGDAFKNPTGGLPSIGIAWGGPGRTPVTLQRLVRGHVAKGVRITDASGVNDVGLMVGSATRVAAGRATASRADQTEDAVLLTPPDELGTKIQREFGVDGKRADLESLATALDKSSGGKAPTGNFNNHRSIHGVLNDIRNDIDDHVDNALCGDADRLGDAFRSFDYTDASFSGEDLLQFKLDGIKSANEMRRELRCGD